MAQSEFHVVVFGATSFVGQILSRYLLTRHGTGGDLKWAMAGRSQAKLEQLRASLGPQAATLPLIVADAADEAALRQLCARTRVVCSTVGPYALYGSPLVKACAESGTDYCDLTGEVQWIARMIAAHESAAKQSGARIVHCCGFDSIPSDLGVQFTQDESRRRHGAPATRVKLRVRTLRGGFSGGTAASLINAVREATSDPATRRIMGNPFAVAPGQGAGKPKQPNVGFAEYDADAQSWVGPFVMAAINTRIVHRSNGLSGDAYGKDFVYDEAMLTGAGAGGWARAASLATGLGGFIAMAAIGPTRKLIEKFVVPQPGEGPSPDEQERGRWDVRFFGRTADGKTVRTKVTGDRDPGYGSTGKMLGEAAACLALDVPKSDKAGGFWTPATAMGQKLRPRLVKHAGLAFEALPD
ncbi:MAG TPA: saccharopine dehydrogenase NADP-binding domain-containing protein [Candidatus Binatia bacterium]|nr:saccharopine dehydrogenase NADP-binding domain-containing protein [Candidatus Binatia bacterium]